jgi:hypothetical protein
LCWNGVVRWSACAWLFVVGCFAPPGPPYQIQLLSADPPVVSIHGGDWVTISYEGDLPAYVGVEIEGVVSPPIKVDRANRTLTVAAPVHEAGTVGVALFDTERGRAIAANDNLLTYQVMAAKPSWNVSPHTQASLDWPLHPKLSHPCARGGDVFFENLGDEPLEVTSVRSSDPEFTLSAPAGRPLGYREYERLTVCFASTTPGSHSASLTASTNAGDVALNVSANVAPPLTGLDPTFHGGGLAFNLGEETPSPTGVIGIGGDGILTWAGMRLIAIDSTGTEVHRDIPPTFIGSVPADMILAARTAPGGGGYALVVNSSQREYGTIIRFDDALVPNAQFDLPNDVLSFYFDLQVAPSGRLLAIGLDIVAMTADGAVDTTYGSNGHVTLGQVINPAAKNHTMIDSQGRLYVAMGGGRLQRFTAEGVLDTVFSSNLGNLTVGSVDAVTIDTADIYILTNKKVVHVSDTGASTILFVIPSPLQPGSSIGYDIAVDSSGRLYVTTGAGLVTRYTSGVASADLGYGNASSVICPPNGACYILGVDVMPKIPDSTGRNYMDKYVLRLAD